MNKLDLSENTGNNSAITEYDSTKISPTNENKLTPGTGLTASQVLGLEAALVGQHPDYQRRFVHFWESLNQMDPPAPEMNWTFGGEQAFPQQQWLNVIDNYYAILEKAAMAKQRGVNRHITRFKNDFKQAVAVSMQPASQFEMPVDLLEKPNYLKLAIHLICTNILIFKQSIQNLRSRRSAQTIAVQTTNPDAAAQLAILAEQSKIEYTKKRYEDAVRDLEQQKIKRGIGNTRISLENITDYINKNKTVKSLLSFEVQNVHDQGKTYVFRLDFKPARLYSPTCKEFALFVVNGKYYEDKKLTNRVGIVDRIQPSQIVTQTTLQSFMLKMLVQFVPSDVMERDIVPYLAKWQPPALKLLPDSIPMPEILKTAEKPPVP